MTLSIRNNIDNFMQSWVNERTNGGCDGLLTASDDASKINPQSV